MFFNHLSEQTPDAVFGLVELFKKDPRPDKIDLIAGIYKDEKLQAKLLDAAKKALEETKEENFIADYLPIDGLASFHQTIAELSLGKVFWEKEQTRIYSAQALGGTGALQLGSQLLARHITTKIAVSNPTWANHYGIFEKAGLTISTYPYYNEKEKIFDLKATLDAFNRLEENTAVLLHTVCHNPTGSDPSSEEWEEISAVMRKKRLIPLFDFAYQGFGEGIEKDRNALEIFLKNGHEMLIGYSCSKNFSLCRQRVGALIVVSENNAVKVKVASQVKNIIRGLYSNPPAFGALIASKILQTPSLKKEWEAQADHMRLRLQTARESLDQRLNSSPKGKHFAFLRGQKGMFSFTGLDKLQAEKLRKEFGIYILDTGRVSLSGINSQNVDFVADAILSV